MSSNSEIVYHVNQFLLIINKKDTKNLRRKREVSKIYHSVDDNKLKTGILFFEGSPHTHYAGISGHPEGSTPGQPTGLAGDL